jgi:hypothetical protein
MGYTPTGPSSYPVMNPPAASPPATSPARTHAPQAEAPAQSFLPDAPSTLPPKVTEQPAPKSPPTSTAPASGTAAPSDSAASTNVAGSSGNRPSLDLCKIPLTSQICNSCSFLLAKAAFLAKKPTPLTERPVHNIDDGTSHIPLTESHHLLRFRPH